MENVKILPAETLKKWRDESDAKIASILSSPNMDIPEGSTVYYVSPNGDDRNDGTSPEKAWRTLEPVNARSLERGAYVCFERGGVWRGIIYAKEGVTYTAYGEGEKPKLYRSPFNGADESLWTPTDVENVWRIALDEYDVGTLVFNEGEAHATKRILRYYDDGRTVEHATGEAFADYHDLKNDLDFWHDYTNDGSLYLYSVENPGKRFDSIEFNSKLCLFNVGVNDVTIDNLCIKYVGFHGVGASTVKGLTVKNCEFGWIGGSIQHVDKNRGDSRDYDFDARLGNAVEVYGGCEDYTVTDNYIYQVYDAGITQQYSIGEKSLQEGKTFSQKNVTYARNVIENCNYSIEYWLGWNGDYENSSIIENFLIEDNYMWYAGFGFCEQRPDPGVAQHIQGWVGGHKNPAKGFVIRDNLLYESKDSIMCIWSSLLPEGETDSLPTLSGNDIFQYGGRRLGIFFQSPDTSSGRAWMKYSVNAPELITKATDDRFWIAEE